jgi:hypothetical protein
MRRAVVTLGVLGVLVGACQWIAGIERLDKPLHQDAGDAASSDPCAHVRPPPPPAVDDDSSFALDPFVLAVSKVDFAPSATGFDLDQVCTCDRSPGSAHDGGSSCNGTPPCDADGGIDDALSGVSAFQLLGTVDDALGVNANIASGNSTILLLVAEYNGRANDKDVKVGFVLSDGINDGSGCPDAGPSAANGLIPPAWCGNDVWTVQGDTVIQRKPPYSAAFSTQGYVTNHRLVIPGNDQFVRLLLGATEAQFNAPTFVGTLTPLNADLTPRDPSTPPTSAADRFYKIDDGVFAGRISDASLLTMLGGVVVQRSSYLCMSPVFDQLKQEVCAARDLAPSPSLDFDPSASCSSLSVSFGLAALPAVTGAVLDAPVTTNPCLPGPSADGGLEALYRCAN